MPVTTGVLVDDAASTLLLVASARTEVLLDIFFFNVQRDFLCDTLKLKQRKMPISAFCNVRVI
jgi:hypothetical protein